MKRCPECRRVYEDRVAFCQIDRAALDRLGVDSLIGKAVTPRCRLIRKLGGGVWAQFTSARKSRPATG